MFRDARNMVITGGTFTSQIMSSNDGREGLVSLQKNIASGAFHNSAERYDPPKCHQQTREAVLKSIMDWVKDAAKLCLFIWLYGPAGAGKSAIAQTIAEMCHRDGILAGSFFFSRSVAGRNNEIFLITTLAYQLTITIPEIRDRVGKALEDDPLLLSRSLQAQVEALIIKPLNDAAEDDPHLRLRPRFIIIDGLDECGESRTHRYILNIFLDAVKQLTIPLFFLLASRPDPLIRDTFNEQPLHSLTTRIVLDDSYKPDTDIKRFLESRFNDIKQKHPLLLNSWPSELNIKLLVQKSSGQFIYASTVMKYLDSSYHWPPDRLDSVFGLSAAATDNPLAELDLFYHHILSSVQDVGKVIEVLTVILFVEFTKTRNVVEDILFYRRGEVDTVLRDLHSLIQVPLPNDEHGELQIFHASLPDFLLDRSRSGIFYIDTAQANTKLTKLCLKHFKQPHVMCQDGINLHRLRAHFMLHCVNAQPTPDLLEELYDIDMSAHLAFWASDKNVFGILEHDNKRILNLFMWLENKASTSELRYKFISISHRRNRRLDLQPA
ncbi:hypothetical protein GALMADRAFT_888788 [Galerina marginata CBS 339.88]|uniref:Nephrocystin 3-like N-terminal domain-containing protein n=1 Tax=Galerina marginata (strain CBS 339.88) TaxID=685588 RepID=A0A067SGU2_GALM3|nr:hypothetical protein GALMADRAFT_888788 [Galerina marginata CBS 339.88]